MSTFDATAMTLLTNDPDTQLAFSVFENAGVYALLLGSGLSRAAGIPTGWEITLDLIRRVGTAQGAEKQVDWTEWYQEKTGALPSYSDLIEELGLKPDERRSILHNYIEPTAEDRQQGRKTPTRAHLAVADLVRGGFIRVIITTNFDRLMESALRDRGIEPTVVASADALAGAEPLVHTNCYILKLHGDYKDARILNTDIELRSYPPAYDRLLDRIFDEYGLIIAGWSGEWDLALRAALLRTVNRRYTVYWAARGKIGDTAMDLVNHRRARIVPITDADSFFIGLHQKIETLRQSRVQNPQSVELLVGSAKRYLPRQQYRVQLDELFSAQVNQLVAHLESPDASPASPWSQEELRRRVTIYQGATEALARMIGVLGRWGDDSEMPLALEVIRTVYAHAEKDRVGSAPLFYQRSYPAVLTFTAYGLGLTRAERWASLHRLFSAEIQVEQHVGKRVVDTLFLHSWQGYDKNLWDRIEGGKVLLTPLSDHLCTLMAEWGQSFVEPTPDFELLFERFELLASLAELESNSGPDIRAALSQTTIPDFMHMPVGRVVWDNARRIRLTAEIRLDERRSALKSAGFANKSDEFLKLFELNLERMADRYLVVGEFL